jgi:hypothetical protein
MPKASLSRVKRRRNRCYKLKWMFSSQGTLKIEQLTGVHLPLLSNQNGNMEDLGRLRSLSARRPRTHVTLSADKPPLHLDECSLGLPPFVSQGPLSAILLQCTLFLFAPSSPVLQRERFRMIGVLSTSWHYAPFTSCSVVNLNA